MSSVPPVVVSAWNSECFAILWNDEREHYEQEFDVEDPSEIATADLKEGNYKNLRALDDFINAVCFSLFSFS